MDIPSVAGKLLVLLFLSGLFSGAETAFTSISRSKAELVRKEKSRVSRVTVFLYDRLDLVITLNLLISNLVNIIISAYITLLATTYFTGAEALTYAVATGTILILIFGEILPKKLAILFPIKFAKFSAYLLYILYYAFYPIIIPLAHGMKLFDRFAKKDDNETEVSEAEVGVMLDLGKQEGSIESGEHEIIKKIFLLNDKTVKSVMTPRVDIIALDENSTVKDFIALSSVHNRSRIPLFQDDVNHITKVVSMQQITNHLLEPDSLDKSLNDLPLNKAFKVPETKILDDLFREFQAQKVHMAIVIDEFGHTSGLITLEDIIEEILGDIEDETDTAEPLIFQNQQQQILAEGKTNLSDVFDFIKQAPSEHQSTLIAEKTIAGYILETLHRFPKEQELLPCPELPFDMLVTAMKHTQIKQVEIKMRGKKGGYSWSFQLPYGLQLTHSPGSAEVFPSRRGHSASCWHK